MKAKYLKFDWLFLGKLVLLTSLGLSTVSPESLTNFISQDKPLLQNQQLENIARVVPSKDEIEPPPKKGKTRV